MRIITPQELVGLIQDITSGDELYTKYLSWNWLDDKDYDKLQFLGMLAYTGTYAEYPSPYNYWMPAYPIALHCYPNNDCNVYQCKEGLFLVYDEISGHVPEKRCRLLQRELIVLE